MRLKCQKEYLLLDNGRPYGVEMSSIDGVTIFAVFNFYPTISKRAGQIHKAEFDEYFIEYRVEKSASSDDSYSGRNSYRFAGQDNKYYGVGVNAIATQRFIESFQCFMPKPFHVLHEEAMVLFLAIRPIWEGMEEGEVVDLPL